MAKLKTTRWRIDDHLTSPQDISYFLEAVLEERDPDFLLIALQDAARAARRLLKARKPGAKVIVEYRNRPIAEVAKEFSTVWRRLERGEKVRPLKRLTVEPLQRGRRPAKKTTRPKR